MLPLNIEITDQNGIQWRPPYRNLKFAKTFYGGEDLWMAFVLDRDASQDYPDVGYGFDVELRNGLAPRFAGEIRQIESDLETVTVKVLGRFVYLDDYNYRGQGMLWCDSRFGRWSPVTQEMSAAYAPDRFQMDTQNRLGFLPTSGERYSNVNYWGALYYWCPYDLVERISFDYDFANSNLDYAPIDGTAMAWELRLYSNTGTPDAWGVDTLEWSVNVNGSGVKDWTFAVPKSLIYFRFMHNGAETYQGRVGANWDYARVTNLRIWGNQHHLSRAVESPSVIHVAESMIRTVPPTDHFDLVRESLYVRDTFRENGASLDARMPDIDKQISWWNEALGDWDIQGQEAHVVAYDANLAIAAIDSGVSDGIVTVDAWSGLAGHSYPALLFRYTDNNNYWRFTLNPINGNLTLEKMEAAAQTQELVSNVGVEYDYWYNLMVKLRGDRIDCYLGGVWRFGMNLAFNETATEHGLYAELHADLVFDNFEVFQALPLWPLFYERGQSWHRALMDATSYGDWDFRALGWGVEPGGSRLYLRRADRSRVRYVIPPHHASRLSARGQTDKDFVTEAWGQFIDEDGVERFTAKYYAHVTPTGIVANTTPPVADDDSAQNVYGVFRDTVINFGREDVLLAEEYLRQYLEEHAHPQVKSSFEIFGPVQDRFKGGAWIQPYELEMGYLVQIPRFRAVEAVGVTGTDIRWDVGGGSDTTFLLVAMQYDAENGKAKLIPEGASEDLERLMKYSRDVERGQEKSLIDKRREASFSR